MKFNRSIALLLVLCLLSALCPTVFATEADSEAVARLVSEMTLEEKIGQMIMPDIGIASTLSDETAKAIADYGFGGIILFGDNTVGTANTTALCYDLQKSAKIPLLISVDQEGGYITRLSTGTTTAGNMALGATGDSALARETGRIIGSELAALGINVDFAPDMDVNNNPANPIIGIRSFSDDPQIVAEMGTAFLDGLQGENISAALKHFPGHGDTAIDSHTGLPSINKSLKELQQLELVPFQAGIDAGTDMIMTAHIQYPQIETETYISKLDGKEISLPATLSKKIITDILRTDMGYDGVVCTDAMRMDAIAKHFDPMDAARLAINAGVDILLVPVSLANSQSIAACGDYILGIVQMVKDGEIQENTIDAAVTRILTLKEKRGILDAVPTDRDAQISAAREVVGSKANHDGEWDICKKAVTLVKNDDMLPISLGAGDKAVLFCSYANEKNSMTYAMNKLLAEGIISTGAQWKVLCYNGETELDAVDQKAVNEADVVIASVETYRTGNITGGWQASFLDNLIAYTHKQGKMTAIISLQLPYDLARYQEADAILAAYGSQGMDKIPESFDGETPSYGLNLPAAVCSIFGGFTPTGTLPVNIPKLDKAYNYTDNVLYPRGFGLMDYGKDDDMPFTDVDSCAFYYDAAKWAYRNKVVLGTTKTTFSPNMNCTRGQFITMLYRMAGSPAFMNANTFTDVPVGSYYEKAVVWASGKGIALGYGNQKFGPEDPITREQMVVMLYRYADNCAKQNGQSLTDYSSLTLKEFADCASVSNWALPAVRWAVGEKILLGDGKNLLHSDLATRAQLVTVLYRDARRFAY